MGNREDSKKTNTENKNIIRTPPATKARRQNWLTFMKLMGRSMDCRDSLREDFLLPSGSGTLSNQKLDNPSSVQTVVSAINKGVQLFRTHSEYHQQIYLSSTRSLVRICKHLNADLPRTNQFLRAWICPWKNSNLYQWYKILSMVSSDQWFGLT